MNKTIASPAPTDSYLRLVKKFPLRPIRNAADWEAAQAMANALAIRGERNLDAGTQDYLETLVLLLDAYDAADAANWPSGNLSPLERLKRLLNDSGTTPAQLTKILGCSQPLVSLILNGKRALSKANARQLATYFKLDVGYFLD